MVHLGMRHQCKLCETRFKRSCDLKMHLKTEHGLDHYNASKVCQKSMEQVNEEFKAKNADNYLPNDIPDQHFDSVQDGETFTSAFEIKEEPIEDIQFRQMKQEIQTEIKEEPFYILS